LNKTEDFNYHLIPDENKDSNTGEKFLEYFLGNSIEEAESTYEEFSGLLNKISYSYACSSGLEKRDIFSEAIVGLARAKRDFNPERSINFKTYAIFLIKNSINDYIRKLSNVISVPAYIKLANSHIVAIKSMLLSIDITNKFMEYVTNPELLNDLCISEIDKKSFKYRLVKLNKASVRAGIDLKELIKRAEYIPTSCNEYDENVVIIENDNDNYIFNNEMIDKLTDKMNAIDKDIAQRILNGQSYTEIGSVYGKSRNWAVQRLSRFGKKIRKMSP
jgi:RNA polymerase sigma factor (sigma-70 family)